MLRTSPRLTGNEPAWGVAYLDLYGVLAFVDRGPERGGCLSVVDRYQDLPGMQRFGETGCAVQYEVWRQREQEAVLSAQRLALGAVDDHCLNALRRKVGQLECDREACAASASESDGCR
nr:hypothetical protein [Kribbella qitaiheensis]